MIKVKKLPKIKDIKENEIYEIDTTNVAYFTHSFFKYPAKFIPQIPNWAITNFTNVNDIVLDCFCGSGTTLVESSLNNRKPLGVDFDKISLLLSSVKTTKLNKSDFKVIKNSLKSFDYKNYQNRDLPDFKNIEYWFPEKNIYVLNGLYYFINNLNITDKIKNFLLVCYISTIRKSSYSEELSPKPYISSKYKKTPKETFTLFKNVIEDYFNKINDENYRLEFASEFIGNDARNFDCPQYYNKIKLVCSSPPYINAFDYVRVLRLENVWLRNINDSNIINHKKNQIGTEQIYSSEYNSTPNKIGLKELDDKIEKLYGIDKKRSHVVFKYFVDMEKNIKNIGNYLTDDGYYIIVVGDCKIRDIDFPTYKYFIELAKRNDYSDTFVFSYVIKNPYLRIPRKDRGGLIKYDRVVILKK